MESGLLIMGPTITVTQSAHDKGRHFGREAKFTMLWPKRQKNLLIPRMLKHK